MAFRDQRTLGPKAEGKRVKQGACRKAHRPLADDEAQLHGGGTTCTCQAVEFHAGQYLRQPADCRNVLPGLRDRPRARPQAERALDSLRMAAQAKILESTTCLGATMGKRTFSEALATAGIAFRYCGYRGVSALFAWVYFSGDELATLDSDHWIALVDLPSDMIVAFLRSQPCQDLQRFLEYFIDVELDNKFKMRPAMPRTPEVVIIRPPTCYGHLPCYYPRHRTLYPTDFERKFTCRLQAHRDTFIEKVCRSFVAHGLCVENAFCQQSRTACSIDR